MLPWKTRQQERQLKRLENEFDLHRNRGRVARAVFKNASKSALATPTGLALSFVAGALVELERSSKKSKTSISSAALSLAILSVNLFNEDWFANLFNKKKIFGKKKPFSKDKPVAA